MDNTAPTNSPGSGIGGETWVKDVNQDQVQNNFEPEGAPGGMRESVEGKVNRKRPLLIGGVVGVLVLVVMIMVYWGFGQKKVSEDPNDNGDQALRISVGREVEFSEIGVQRRVSNDADKTICNFIKLPGPVRKVIRSQGEFEDYVTEAEDQGYEAFAKNRDQYEAYAAFRDIATLEAYRSYCSDYFSYAEVDFDRYTLLGQFTSTGGCSASFDKKIIQDDERETVKFTIDVNSNGTCEKWITNFNWVLIPSIPGDYQVEFEILRGGQIPPTPSPSPDLSGAVVPNESRAVEILNANRAIELWKSYMDKHSDPEADLRMRKPSPEISEAKWFVSMQGVKNQDGFWMVRAWIDPYSGKMEVLDFTGTLEKLSPEQQAAIRAVNDLPERYE